MPPTQQRLKGPGPLLTPTGALADVGWSTQPLLDCNLENAHFYKLRFLQGLRIKRWDYYGITTPTHFYSFTISDIGYLQLVFAYVVDFAARTCREETLTLLPGAGVSLPRSSTAGVSHYSNGKVSMTFTTEAEARRLEVNWPGFISADVRMALPPEHESMVIVIPIKGQRFYYNRKVNCMPAQGWVELAGQRVTLDPAQSLANMDWGRGVWEYKSFWVWTTASNVLPDGRRLGLNLGYGFGDTSAATENAFILDGKVHKLGVVDYVYDPQHLTEPWSLRSRDGRLTLRFNCFFDRHAATDAKVIRSSVHQLFGTFEGTLQTDDGETIAISNYIGCTEEHHARW